MAVLPHPVYDYLPFAALDSRSERRELAAAMHGSTVAAVSWNGLLETISEYQLASGLVATLLLVVVTLVGWRLAQRHDRQIRAEKALDGAILELNRTSEIMVKVFIDRGFRLDHWDKDVADAHFDLTNAMVMAIARAKKRQPKLHRALTDLLDHCHPSRLREGDGRGLGAVKQLSLQWLSDPKPILRRWPRKRETADKMIGRSGLDHRDPGPQTNRDNA